MTGTRVYHPFLLGLYPLLAFEVVPDLRRVSLPLASLVLPRTALLCGAGIKKPVTYLSYGLIWLRGQDLFKTLPCLS